MKRVLIANRGEIAARIQRSCDALGIESVITVSDADQDALFAQQAHQIARLPGNSAAETYLALEAILSAAREFQCDAIHPGYGFLSENSEFCRRVEETGLIFVGPHAEAIRIMGSKTEARRLVQEFQVPVVPGTLGGLSNEELLAQASKLHFPLLIKSVGGGGGRGMRVVRSLEELESLLPRARAEALKNFANADVFLERYIEQPRHVEVQVLGDKHGGLIHFGTRDCSVQRRHQKLVEEAPAPFLSDSLRERIHQAALNAAKSVQYDSVGTVELLVKDDEIFFLEMNTRIQVEHPVTEEVTGVDLVGLQLEVARGKKIPLAQEEVCFEGHSIELRIYAEDPANEFRPSLGRVTQVKRPDFPFLREDHSLEAGTVVSPHYDAMLSKLIVKGKNRSESLSLLRQVLSEYEVAGIETNLGFHQWLLCLTPFANAPVDIHFVTREFNAERLEELAQARVPDPLHRRGPAGAEYVELFQYQLPNSTESIAIELIHRSDGYFLARPVLQGGRSATSAECRISNGRDACLKALIEEVLDQQ